MITACAFVLGCWLVLNALLLTPSNNILSKLFFCVIPFILGIYGLVSGAKLMGWL